MLITNTTTLKTYLQTFKNRLGIKDVQFGDYDRILTFLKSQTAKYPLLWIERPTYKYIENGGRKKEFSIALVIVKNANTQTTFAQEDEIIAECETIMENILTTLEDEASEDTFEFDKTTVNIESFERTSGDLMVGCRAEIQLIGGIECEV
jgi:hypothetical protein